MDNKYSAYLTTTTDGLYNNDTGNPIAVNLLLNNNDTVARTITVSFTGVSLGLAGGSGFTKSLDAKKTFCVENIVLKTGWTIQAIADANSVVYCKLDLV
jgi:hypothetical protein